MANSPAHSYSPSLPLASTLHSGLVRLATNGEAKEGVALQANDRRLLDATTERKGIVELASDGEEGGISRSKRMIID